MKNIRGGGGGQGGCVQRIEVIVKRKKNIRKQNVTDTRVGRVGGLVGEAFEKIKTIYIFLRGIRGRVGGCEQRSEAFVKIVGGGGSSRGGGGVSVDVNGEVKLL